MIDSRLRPMTADDLLLVLRWRNDPAVREHLFTRHEIGESEHRSWFERSAAMAGRELLVHVVDGAAAGFVSFDALGHDSIVEWGFYRAPEAPRGSGRLLGRAALQHAFELRRRHKVVGRTLAANARALGFHLALGFREEGRLRDHHWDGGTYHDVVCFGLLRAEAGYRT
jgi:UDP-4-amino-4,6-dideoxy-N-acetyl-beta-L-altrosamine N-acetyltransferase